MEAARGRWIVAGVAAVALVGGCLVVEGATGAGPEAARYEERLAEAGRWGFDEGMSGRIAMETARPKAPRAAWFAFLVRSRSGERPHPDALPHAEFVERLPRLRQRFDEAVAAARRMNGGAARRWSDGFTVLFPDLARTRANGRWGARLAARAQEEGRLEEALQLLEETRELYRPTAGEPVIISQVVNAGGAATLFRAAERALAAPELTRAQSLRLGQLLSDPVFGPGATDRELLGFDTWSYVQIVREPLDPRSLGWTAPNPAYARIAELSRDPAVRRAWQSDALRIANETAARLPHDPNDWEGRRRAWAFREEEMRRPGGVAGAFRRETMRLFGEPDVSWLSLLQEREASRRVLELAGFLRAGVPEQSARQTMGARALDPFDGQPLRVRRSGSAWPHSFGERGRNGDPGTAVPTSPPIVVYSVGRDGQDDAGAPMRDGKGDLGIFIPREPARP